MTKILQVGIGPLGQKIFQYSLHKSSVKVVAAVDIDHDKIGKDLGEICDGKPCGVIVSSSMSQVKNLGEIDVAILTTSSTLASIAPQIIEIINYGIPIVSTCEELTFPFRNNEKLCRQIDDFAKAQNVAVVSTGVNPGFLMDTLPSLLTAVCKEVQHISVNRIQDAQSRRLPFQKKIGAGLNIEEFELRRKEGSLRHVGLTESMLFIADALGWEIDHTEDVISPIIANKEVVTRDLKIRKGDALGVRQVGAASFEGREKIKLVFEAAVGTGESYDEVIIKGEPNITSKINGGVHGDIATCSIVLNIIPALLKSGAGLKTMKDMSLASCIQ